MKTTFRAIRGARTGSKSRPIDLQRLANALRSRIDTRIWISFGTIGVLSDNGSFDPTNRNALYSEPNGVVCDVRLEPSGHHVTANYHGLASGKAGSIFFPVMEGDGVLVLIPDGDLNSPAIAALPFGSSATAQIPKDFNSNRGVPRVLVDLNVPLEIRAPSIILSGGAQIVINGRIVAGGSEPL